MGWHKLETVGVGSLAHGENVEVWLSDPGDLNGCKVINISGIVSSTDSSVAKVLDPTLQYDGPAQGGVDQAPAGVDEVRRRLRVDQFVG